MSACSFDFQMTVEPEALVRKFEALSVEHSGEFSGDVDSGRFALNILFGCISGEYCIADELVTITITEKPFLMGCEMIRGAIRDFSKGALL